MGGERENPAALVEMVVSWSREEPEGTEKWVAFR